MTYKNYKADFAYSREDEVYFGKVSNIEDLVTFEGRTPEELEGAFQEAVEDYIQTCKELNKPCPAS